MLNKLKSALHRRSPSPLPPLSPLPPFIPPLPASPSAPPPTACTFEITIYNNATDETQHLTYEGERGPLEYERLMELVRTEAKLPKKWAQPTGGWFLGFRDGGFRTVGNGDLGEWKKEQVVHVLLTISEEVEGQGEELNWVLLGANSTMEDLCI